MTDGCGASAGGAAGTVDYAAQAVVEGRVVRDGAPAAVGYARLLNADGEFVAEVPLGDGGEFRFFAAPGDWTVRVLVPGGVSADRAAVARYGGADPIEIAL